MSLTKRAGVVLSTVFLAIALAGCSNVRDMKPSKMTKQQKTELKASFTSEDEQIMTEYVIGQMTRVFPANGDLSFNEVKKLVKEQEEKEKKAAKK